VQVRVWKTETVTAEADVSSEAELRALVAKAQDGSLAFTDRVQETTYVFDALEEGCLTDIGPVFRIVTDHLGRTIEREDCISSDPANYVDEAE
jgi:hypothetical protein